MTIKTERLVYLLQHVAREGRDDEDVKVLGVFSSRKEASRAVERFKKLPGFKRYPNGFHIDQHRLNHREWQEGFFTTRSAMNIQIIDGADNATFSIFKATEEEFKAIFPKGRDMEFIEDFIKRVGNKRAGKILSPIWERPLLKRDAQGLHGTLFYNWADRKKHYPATKREVDMKELSINHAQRRLFRANR